MPGFQPKRVGRPREQVEWQLREAIASRALKAGDKLPSEAELARQLGVGRSTLREALRALAADGLIVKVPGAQGGSFVRGMDNQVFSEVVGKAISVLVGLGNADGDEVLAVRELLEVPSARMAAETRTADDLKLLWGLLNQQKSIDVDDPAVSQLDIDFHAGIADATGNRVLGALMRAFHEESRPVDRLVLSQEVGRITVKQHSRIVQAIEDADGDGAAHAAREHIAYLRTVGLVRPRHGISDGEAGAGPYVHSESSTPEPRQAHS